MPIVPKAGKGPIPKDRIGLKIKFMIKPIIRAFLFFFVSPCAYKKELMTLAKIKKEHHMLEFAYSEDHFPKKDH